MYKSHIGGGDADRIMIRGHDLTSELLEKHDFVDVLCLAILGHFPDHPTRKFVNTSLIASIDHGLTPSAISTRLTLHGAPESLQGAVAAGLLGAGSRYLGTVALSANFLRDALGELTHDNSATLEQLKDLAEETAKRILEQHKIVPGFGHPIHKHSDPRTVRAERVAREDGTFGRHFQFALDLANALTARSGRSIPLNATGSKAALLLDLGFEPEFGKALTLIGRTAGLVAHALEERKRPIGQDVWDLVDAESARGAP